MYLNIVLYCLTATKKHTYTVKEIFNKLGGDYETGFTDAFLIENTNRQFFDGPAELQSLGEKLNCNDKLIKDAYADFKLDVVKYYINVFKKAYKVPIRFHGVIN